jgi:hypothetical protein
MKTEISMKYPIVLIIFLSIITGCSSGRTSTAISAGMNFEHETFPDLSVNDNYDSGRQFLGSWILHFNTQQKEVRLENDRALTAHYNITSMLPDPSIQFISYDPVTSIATLNVTITNPFPIDGYDLRLIVYTNNRGIRLLNPDNWTGLHDIPGGTKINPFKAYAKTSANRKFAAFTQHIETFQFYISGITGYVQIAIDASYPGNCAEPYKIDNFVCDDLYETIGSYAIAWVDVYDWQVDVNEVRLYCSQITAADFILMYQLSWKTWVSEIYNITGAQAGDYLAIISATSSGSGQTALYHLVTIHVLESEDNCLNDNNESWFEATPVGLHESFYDCVGKYEGDEYDYYSFYCPPNGAESIVIDLNEFGGSQIEMSLWGADPGTPDYGILLETNKHIEITDSVYSRYFIKIQGSDGLINYNLAFDAIPKLTNINCELYVATDDGTPSGTWPIWEAPDPDEELTIDHLYNLMTWCNNIWNQYGINLVWDGSVTIMNSQFYNLSDDSLMHNTYGKSTGMMSLYFVNQCSSNTAYCVVVWPEWNHNVQNVFTVYSPNIWYWQDVTAHEHGHALGYLFDMYLYDMAGCPCGDNDCLGSSPVLYWDPEACYDGNLMWYSMGYSWDMYNLTEGQWQWIYYFNYHYDENFPWY